MIERGRNHGPARRTPERIVPSPLCSQVPTAASLLARAQRLIGTEHLTIRLPALCGLPDQHQKRRGLRHGLRSSCRGLSQRVYPEGIGPLPTQHPQLARVDRHRSTGRQWRPAPEGGYDRVSTPNRGAARIRHHAVLGPGRGEQLSISRLVCSHDDGCQTVEGGADSRRVESYAATGRLLLLLLAAHQARGDRNCCQKLREASRHHGTATVRV